MAKPEFPRRIDDPDDAPVDPTILIDRVSRRPAPDEIEKTVIIQRTEAGRLADMERPSVAPHVPPGPTIVVRPGGDRAQPGSGADRSTPRQTAAAKRGSVSGAGRSRRRDGWVSLWHRAEVRGALLAIVAVAAAALLVVGAIGLWRWAWPEGYTLVVTKPDHGSIVGPDGVACGTAGESCTVALAKGSRIDVAAEADPGYVFVGFTDGCPNGSVLMNGPRTCGAEFKKIDNPPTALTYNLMIDKPTGGTLVALGDIECGTMRANCAADLQNGILVQLRAKPDAGFDFQNYTGDCQGDGSTRMTAARHCGAVFAPKATATKATTPSIPEPRPRGRATGDGPFGPPAPPTPSGPTSPAPTPPPPPGPLGPTPAGGGEGPSGPPPGANPPPAPPLTDEEHAKKEIKELVGKYCDALMSRKAAEVKNLQPSVDVKALEFAFKETRSLKCTVTTPPEYITLDPRSAGQARIKFGMKRVQVMQTSGAQQVVELVVTMRLARENFGTRWVIDNVLSEVKER